jgi:hypothetical protein
MGGFMRKRTIAFCVVVLLLFCSASFSEAFKLPDTGQIECYNTAGSIISCAGSGQDGAYTINPLSYTDNGDGTVTDNNTGLMWQQQVADNKMTWSEAGAYCSSLTLGGYSDWKLPSKTKLMSIVDYSIPNPGPSINPIFMPYSGHYFGYWTSTPYARYPHQAWVVYFSSGGLVMDFGGDGYARCVRGGAYPARNFIDNGDGTVSDTTTGLMWQQGEPGNMEWESALAYCQGLSIDGHSDWRLPNNKELESISDAAKWGPAIDATYFPNTYANDYWSSTTYAAYPNMAWVSDFTDGSVGSSLNKASSANARCVRGGLPNILRIMKSGTGAGTITSSPAGINCGTDCKEEYSLGREVILTATANPGSIFTGWSGDPDCADGSIVSDGPKTCTASFSSTLRILTPVSGEMVSTGSPYDITWEVLDDAVTFKLFYSIDNKLTWVPITKTASGVSYSWTVPSLIKNKKAYLKIVGFTAGNDRRGTGISDAYFVIEAVSILSPHGGSQPLISGTPVDITWRTTPTPKASIDSYSLHFTTDGGLNWRLIGSGEGNPGTHSWTPFVAKTKSKCLVKVILKDASGATVGIDTSDGFFSILQ